MDSRNGMRLPFLLVCSSFFALLLSVMQLWYSANSSWSRFLSVPRMNLSYLVIVHSIYGIRPIFLAVVFYLFVV